MDWTTYEINYFYSQILIDNDEVYVTLYDYYSDHTDIENMMLDIEKGSQVIILDNSIPSWLFVRNIKTKKEGYIPDNYVAKKNELEAQEWYFDKLTRIEAKNILMNNENPLGTFLVRQSDNIPGGYALSLKIFDKITKTITAVNYKINTIKKANTMCYYIIKDENFSSIFDLIQMYSKNDKLLHKLTYPCPKEEEIYCLGPEIGKNWEISRKDITLERELGCGNFGVVYAGKWRNKKEVAVKILKPRSMSIQEFLAEACIMKTLHHKNLVTLYAICSKEEPIYIIQEYVKGGSLLSHLIKHKNCIKQETLQYMAAQVASGMQYIEMKHLIHRDLAARNVLVGSNDTVKICDFGLARSISVTYISQTEIEIPIKWTAIESLTNRVFTIKSDVWSFGVLMMEIYTFGDKPYKEISPGDLYDKIIEGHRMPKPKEYEIPDDIYELMLQCWIEAPENRPTFEYLAHYLNSTTLNEPRYEQF